MTYLSNLVVATEVPLLDGFGPINKLRQNLSDAMNAIIDERLQYGGIRLDVDFERFQRPAPIAPLTIQDGLTTLSRTTHALFGSASSN